MNDSVILLPTKNRPSKLADMFRYFLKYPACPTIFVADSSDSNYVMDNNNVVSKFSDKLNIIHVLYPSDLSFFRKLYQAVDKLSDFQFVLITADDDYLSLSISDQCLSFLRESKSHSHAQGINVVIEESLIDVPEPSKCKIGYSMLSNSPFDRLNKYLAIKGPRIYGYHRRDSLIHVLENTAAVVRDDIDRFAESYFNMFVVLTGKCLCINEVGYVSVFHGENAGILENKKKLPTEVERECFEEQVDVGASAMSRFLMKGSGESLGFFKDRFKQIIYDFYYLDKKQSSYHKRHLAYEVAVKLLLLPVKASYVFLDRVNVRERVVVNSRDEFFNLKMQLKHSSFRKIFKKINEVA